MDTVTKNFYEDVKNMKINKHVEVYIRKLELINYEYVGHTDEYLVFNLNRIFWSYNPKEYNYINSRVMISSELDDEVVIVSEVVPIFLYRNSIAGYHTLYPVEIFNTSENRIYQKIIFDPNKISFEVTINNKNDEEVLHISFKFDDVQYEKYYDEPTIRIKSIEKFTIRINTKLYKKTFEYIRWDTEKYYFVLTMETLKYWNIEKKLIIFSNDNVINIFSMLDDILRKYGNIEFFELDYDGNNVNVRFKFDNNNKVFKAKITSVPNETFNSLTLTNELKLKIYEVIKDYKNLQYEIKQKEEKQEENKEKNNGIIDYLTTNLKKSLKVLFRINN